MRYLNSAEVFAIHKYVVDRMKGAPGVRDPGLLFSLCEKPKAAFGGVELYKGVFQKAAALMEAIVSYHVFADANKRTAWMATFVFLTLNGYELKAKKMESYRFVMKIAVKGGDVHTIAEWLKQHSRPR